MRLTLPAVINGDNAHQVLADGLRAIAAGQTEFDFAPVREADSAAVAVLLAWQRKARATGVALAVANLPASVRGLAHLYDVAQFLPLPHHSV